MTNIDDVLPPFAVFIAIVIITVVLVLFEVIITSIVSRRQNMTAFEDEHKKVQAKFNAGIAKLERLHFIRLKIHNARLDKDYSGWFDNLQSWRSEINDRFDKEERGAADDYETNITIGLIAHSNRQTRMMLNHGFVDNNKASKGLTFFRDLYAYELWLGDKEKEYGYGMPEGKDKRFALGRG